MGELGTTSGVVAVEEGSSRGSRAFLWRYACSIWSPSGELGGMEIGIEGLSGTVEHSQRSRHGGQAAVDLTL